MEERLEKARELKDLNLLDNFLFLELAEDQEAVESILEIVLGEEIKLQEKPKTEKEERADPLLKRVRLDVYSLDADNIYDIEVQKKMQSDLRKRIRFYRGLLDYQLVKAGAPSYNELRNLYIIMIAPFDLFGDQRYKYTFKMTCQENKDIELGDEQTVIFLNINGKNREGASQELIDMLKYFQETREEIASKSNSDKIKFLQKKVDEIKSSEKVGVRYMNRWEEEIEIREEGKKEGRKEGRAIEKLEIARKMKEMTMSISDIVKATGLTETEIQEL